MDAEGEILEDGLMFTVFEEGPWAGFKFPGDPSMGWVSGGKDHFELMVSNSFKCISFLAISYDI